MPYKRAKSYCITYGCLNNDKTRPDLSFFTLPKDGERRREWLIRIDREDLLEKEQTGRKRYLVCSAHFEESSLKIGKVTKSDAVPKLLLPKKSKRGKFCSEATTQTAAAKGQEIWTLCPSASVIG